MCWPSSRRGLFSSEVAELRVELDLAEIPRAAWPRRSLARTKRSALLLLLRWQPFLALFCADWLLGRRCRLDGEELGLVGLHGVEESVEVGSAGCGEFGRNETQAARGVERVALNRIF